MEDDERVYYDPEVPMCRDCLMPYCSPRYCVRATNKMRIDMDNKKRLMREPAYGVVGALFND